MLGRLGQTNTATSVDAGGSGSPDKSAVQVVLKFLVSSDVREGRVVSAAKSHRRLTPLHTRPPQRTQNKIRRRWEDPSYDLTSIRW